MARLRPLAGAAVAATLLATGCTSPFAPFVLSVGTPPPGEDGRAPPPEAREVVVCATGLATSRTETLLLAEEACAGRAETALYQGKSVGDCPLAVPVAVRFACVKP